MPADINDENLVAFLDGELPPHEASTIEQAVHSNVELQKRVTALKTSWDLLGDLPEEEFSPELAQTTIEMVTMAIEKESQSWFGWLRKNRLTTLVLCCGLALLAGVANGRKKMQAESRDVLANLDVALEAPALKDIRSTDFLKTLAGIENLMSFRTQQANQSHVDADEVISLTLAEREQWVAGLDESQRREVSASVERFRGLTENERQKTQEIFHYILDQKDRSPDLLKVVRNFHNLIDRAGTRALVAIQEADASGSPEQVAALVNEEVAFLYELTVQDRSVIRSWFSDVEAREFDLSPADVGNNFSIILRLSLSDADSDNAISEEEIESLYAAFTGRAAELLEAVTDPARRRDLLVYWVINAVMPPAGPASGAESADSATLRAMFDKLPTNQQQQLYILPAESVRKKLLSNQALPGR